MSCDIKKIIETIDDLKYDDRMLVLKKIIVWEYKISTSGEGSLIDLSKFSEVHIKKLLKLIEDLNTIPLKYRLF